MNREFQPSWLSFVKQNLRTVSIIFRGYLEVKVLHLFKFYLPRIFLLRFEKIKVIYLSKMIHSKKEKNQLNASRQNLFTPK